MAHADGRNLGGDKVTFFYLKAPAKALKDKVIEGTAAVADLSAVIAAANELKGVDDVGEYGSESQSTTEQPFGHDSFNVLGPSSLSDLDVTYMPDLSVALDVQFSMTDDLGIEVAFVEQLQGNTGANKTYNIMVGVLGGARRIANKNGAQRYRRRVIVSSMQMGIAA